MCVPSPDMTSVLTGKDHIWGGWWSNMNTGHAAKSRRQSTRQTGPEGRCLGGCLGSAPVSHKIRLQRSAWDVKHGVDSSCHPLSPLPQQSVGAKGSRKWGSLLAQLLGTTATKKRRKPAVFHVKFLPNTRRPSGTSPAENIWKHACTLSGKRHLVGGIRAYDADAEAEARGCGGGGDRF